MPEPVKVNVVSYGGVKPGRVVAGNDVNGGKAVVFDAATAEGGSYAFYKRSGLTSWNVDLPGLTDGDYMFAQSGVVSFAGDLHSLSNSTSMFFRTGLVSFSTGAAGLQALTVGRQMFREARLTSFAINLPELTDGYGMFYLCPLVSFDAGVGGLEKLTDGGAMFSGAGLTSFRAGARGLCSLTKGADMFSGCKLDPASAEFVLETLPDRSGAVSPPTLHLGKNTNFSTSTEVAALLRTESMEEVGIPIPAGTYKCVVDGNDKGWTIKITT